MSAAHTCRQIPGSARHAGFSAPRRHRVGVTRRVFIAVGLDRRSAHCGHPRDGNLFVNCEAVTWQDAEN